MESPKTIHCNQCGAEVNENAVVCVKCGCNPKSPNNRQFCNHCGAKINGNAIVCTNCGCNPIIGKSVGAGSNGRKKKLNYILCAVLLGSLGVHNFYIGKTNIGIIQLLISVLSFFMLSPIVGIWAIIECVKTQTDAQGNPLE